MFYQRFNLNSLNSFKYNILIKNYSVNPTSRLYYNNKYITSNLKDINNIKIYDNEYEYLMSYKLKKSNTFEKYYNLTEDEKYYRQNFDIKYNKKWIFEW